MPLDQIAELEETIGPKRAYALALDEKLARRQREEFAKPGGLLKFIRHFWHVLEPETDFVEGWALDAMCIHLEETAFGYITRLLENVPPGSCKSLLSSVFFPAWVWGALKRPATRFLCMSYSDDNPQRDNRKTINLINSPEYQRLYGKVFRLTKAGEELIETDKTGSKQAIGIRGSVTGKRAGFLIVDDPNNIIEIESNQIREETARKFREAVTNRLNDMVKSVIIVIQQRSYEDDISGTILEAGRPYVHLCIPMLFEKDRRCETFVDGDIFWSDPREEEGECYWPERYPDQAVREAMDMGPFAFAGQYQQRPEPRGGGILKREFWCPWEEKDYPECDFVLASLDPAFTAKTENDPAGFTIWGSFLTKDGFRAAFLLHAFRKKLEFCGPEPKPLPGETYREWKIRTQAEWGLVEHVHDACKRFRVDHLIIENKASGLSIIQTLAKLFVGAKYSIQAYDPKALDKVARMIRVQAEFSGGQIYAPFEDGEPKDWAGMVIDECAICPKGRYDDLTDSTTQGVYWLRSQGFLERREELFLSKEDAARKYKTLPPLYRI